MLVAVGGRMVYARFGDRALSRTVRRRSLRRSWSSQSFCSWAPSGVPTSTRWSASRSPCAETSPGTGSPLRHLPVSGRHIGDPPVVGADRQTGLGRADASGPRHPDFDRHAVDAMLTVRLVSTILELHPAPAPAPWLPSAWEATSPSPGSVGIAGERGVDEHGPFPRAGARPQRLDLLVGIPHRASALGALIAVGIAFVLRGPGGGATGTAAAQGTLGTKWFAVRVEREGSADEPPDSAPEGAKA